MRAKEASSGFSIKIRLVLVSSSPTNQKQFLEVTVHAKSTFEHHLTKKELFSQSSTFSKCLSKEAREHP
jgi:hypothetical protein